MLKANTSIKATKKTIKPHHILVDIILLIAIFQLPAYLDRLLRLEKFSPQATDYELVRMLFLTIIGIALGLVYAVYYHKRDLLSLGIKNPYRVKNYFKGMVIGLLMALMVIFLLRLSGVIDLKLNTAYMSLGLWLLFLLGFIIQGFEEELIFRGIVMNAFAADGGVKTGIIVNSLIFSFMHSGNEGVNILPLINLFILGLIFSLIFYLTDDLFAAAAAHSFWNFSQGNIFGLKVSGILEIKTSIFTTNIHKNSLLLSKNFGIEGGLAATLIELLVLAILLYAIKRRPCKS